MEHNEAQLDRLPSDLSFVVTEDVEGSHEGRSMEAKSDSEGVGVAGSSVSAVLNRKLVRCSG